MDLAKSPAPGRALLRAIQSYFLLVSFPISNSSVTLFRPFCATYTVPVLSCHPYIHSFVSCDDTGREGEEDERMRKRDEYIERLSQSVDEMTGCERFSSTSFYFISDVIWRYYILYLLSSLSFAIYSDYKRSAMTVGEFILVWFFFFLLLRKLMIIPLASMQISWL